MLAFLPIFPKQRIAHAILVLTSVTPVWLAAGRVKYRDIAFGTADVLFAGVLFDHFDEKMVQASNESATDSSIAFRVS
jgi:hypothetical protein